MTLSFKKIRGIARLDDLFLRTGRRDNTLAFVIVSNSNIRLCKQLLSFRKQWSYLDQDCAIPLELLIAPRESIEVIIVVYI